MKRWIRKDLFKEALIYFCSLSNEYDLETRLLWLKYLQDSRVEFKNLNGFMVTSVSSLMNQFKHLNEPFSLKRQQLLQVYLHFLNLHSNMMYSKSQESFWNCSISYNKGNMTFMDLKDDFIPYREP